MAKKTRIVGTPDAWESGALGAAAAHAKRVDPALEAQIDAALELQAISIRLPKAVIETYKMLASIHGVGYQPLMRDAICRWAEAEMKQLLVGAVEQQRQKAASEGKSLPNEDEPAPTPGAPMKKAA